MLSFATTSTISAVTMPQRGAVPNHPPSHFASTIFSGSLATGLAGNPSGAADIAADGAARSCDASHDLICRGTPRFLDSEIAAIAASRGSAAAWLALYRDLDARAPERVEGRFAVVVIDPGARRAFAAVDRFGIETLCYRSTPDAFAFAARADRVPGTSHDVDPQAIFDYLWFHVIPAPRTIRRGVMRLLPGHRLVYERGRCEVSAYWQPHFEESHSSPLPELGEEFRGLLRAAVAQAASGPSVGCFLSGGTDSSTVAGMAGVVTARPARTYSIGFNVPGYDEMVYARTAARHFETDHHEYYVTPQDLVDNIATLAVQFDQPFGNSSALPAFCCARMARQDGVTTMLAGDGGDELFGGNSRYAKQRMFAFYDRLPASLRRHFLRPLADHRRTGQIPLLRKAASYIRQAAEPMPERMEMYNLLLRIGLDTIFEPAFLSAVDPDGPIAQQRRTYNAIPAGTLINRMLAYDWKYALADNDLPKVVGAAMLAGVDVAFPLLDDRLVEFSLRLAPALKLKGLRLRWFFKHALADFLPREILAKKKHGFGLPFGAWAVEHRVLREIVLDSLTAFKRRGIVRTGFVDELIEQRLAAHPGYYGEMVWILMMLEQWLAAHDVAPALPEPAPSIIGRP